MEQRHTDREYAKELEQLRNEVLLMGARVEEMLAAAMRAFGEHDDVLAQRTIAADAQVDRMEVEIDELCIHILARRHPVASDLYLVTSAMKQVTDLERIADLSVNICERAIELAGSNVEIDASSVERMGALAQDMLHDALDAFTERDAFKAQRVLGRDRAVDSSYAQLFPELVAAMMADPNVIRHAAGLQSVGRYLERIADHSTNLAEMVIFMVKGKDVRHPTAQPN